MFLAAWAVPGVLFRKDLFLAEFVQAILQRYSVLSSLSAMLSLSNELWICPGWGCMPRASTSHGIVGIAFEYVLVGGSGPINNYTFTKANEWSIIESILVGVGILC